jgi:hypothetical protein
MTANHGFRSDLVGADQPFDQVVTVHVDGSRVVAAFVERLDDGAFSDEPFEREKPNDDEFTAEEEPPSKIHPILARRLEERSDNDKELILVNLRDDMTIPRFPEPVENEPRESPANRDLQSRCDAMIGQIVAHREEGYRALAQEFADRYGAEIRQTFWLLRCMLLEVPLGMVRRLAERDDVLYIEPNDAGDVPGQNANPNDDVDDGRGRIVSDPYFNLGLTGGFVGLLDTGVRFTHTLLTSPSHIAFRFDCTGGSGCSTGSGSNPNDDCWNHGTAEAAAFTGNVNQGNAFRGVTGITLDSFKVFPTSFNPTTGACNGFLNVAAGISAFQTAVSVFDRVIYGGMQGSGNYLSSLSIAADNAFDAGAVVIGINGNFGPAAGTVNSPGNAHRVIGVGNFHVQTLAQITSQSRGPTPDGRIKPDIQAPTNTETASNASDTALFTFTGTSGAAPYAAGAAALLRNFLLRIIPVVDPGQVYSLLILSGQQVSFNNTSGAGPLRLPTDGTLSFGKVAVNNGGTVDIPLNIGEGANVLDAALWWPETAAVLFGIPIEFHNDVDLHLVNPGGATVATSLSINSVFERARVAGAPLGPGIWTLRIRGFNIPGGPQTVFWSAHAAPR